MIEKRQAVRRPTRKEVDLFYQTHRKQFWRPERVRVWHIVKNADEIVGRDEARAVLDQALAEIQEGVPFEAVMHRYSDCSSEGDLGWFPRGVMVEEFDEAVFRLEPGQITEIFPTCFGWHLVQMLERRESGIAPLSEVQDEIGDYLYRQRMKRTHVQS